MDDHRYIWCRNCGAIHHVSSFDREPIYRFAAGEVEEIPANDWRAFMDRHAGHRLEPLKATGDDYFPSGKCFDPMSVRYIEVSNGAETLLLRRSRSSIDEPFRYEIVSGRLSQNGVSLEIQEEAIRKEMKLHFCWAPAVPLPDEKIACFVALFREVVCGIDPDAACASGYSDVDDNVVYCRLDAAIIEALLDKCSRDFLPAELASLRRFVESHRDSDDVMALVKRRAVAVEQSAH
jgi:hypothetical protein